MKQIKIFLLSSMVVFFTACGGGGDSTTTVEPTTTQPIESEDKLLNETIPGIWFTYVYAQDGVIGSGYLNYELFEDGTAIQSSPYTDTQDYVTTWEYLNGKLVIQLSDGSLSYEPIKYEDEVNKIIQMKLIRSDGDFI